MDQNDISSIPDFAAMYAVVETFDDAPEEYERIIRRVYEATLRPGDAAVDVGAHVGKHSTPLALAVSPGGTVVALEPIPWAYERLAARAEVGGLDSLDVRHGCAGRTVLDSVTFHVVPSRPGWSAKHARPGAEVEEISVSQTTVDTLAEELGPIRFLKIDVEGAEPEVLEGAITTLATSHPIVHVEVSPEALVANDFGLGVLRDQLTAAGYRIFDLLGFDVSDEASWMASAEAKGVFDYVAAHPEQGDDVAEVLEVLRRSFADERTDISAHGMPELLGPPPAVTRTAARVASPAMPDTPDQVLDAAFVAGPNQFKNTVWPTAYVGIAPASIAWSSDGPAFVVDLVTGTADPIDGQALEVGLDSTAETLEIGHELRIELDLAQVSPGRTHQTIAEFHLPATQTVGLCRLHKNGRLETLWIRNGSTIGGDGTVFKPGPLVLSIARRQRTWYLTASGASGSLSAGIDSPNDAQLEVVIGRRRFWPNPERVNINEIPTRITASKARASSNARAAVGTAKHRAKSLVAKNPVTRALAKRALAFVRGRRR